MMGFGAVAVVLLIVVGSIFFKSQLSSNKASGEFAELGSEVQDIGIIGESGLLAAADAKQAELDALAEAMWGEDEEGFEDESNGCGVEPYINPKRFKNQVC